MLFAIVIGVGTVNTDLGHLDRPEGRLDIERRSVRFDKPGETANAGLLVEDDEDDGLLAVHAGSAHRPKRYRGAGRPKAQREDRHVQESGAQTAG